MHRNSLLDLLNAYAQSTHITSLELPYLNQFTSFIASNENCFDRECKGHITGSAWILNQDGTQALLTHHKKLNKWLQLGGHADGDFDIAAVALKEAQEESGIGRFKFVLPGIFDIDIHPIPSACEFHYDIRFLLQVASDDTVIVSDESLALAWVSFDKMESYAANDSVLRMNEKACTILLK
jgi:8-oxo-dGTP pyrophosphatase MutT (NUDIX family)